MGEKKFEFISEAAKRAYKALPYEIQKQFGSDLNAVQQGKPPFSAFKDIADSVGPGAIELIENGSPAYRAVYCVKFLDTVFILHAFEKTTNGVDQQEMATAKGRYKELTALVAQIKVDKKRAARGQQPKRR